MSFKITANLLSNTMVHDLCFGQYRQFTPYYMGKDRITGIEINECGIYLILNYDIENMVLVAKDTEISMRVYGNE